MGETDKIFEQLNSELAEARKRIDELELRLAGVDKAPSVGYDTLRTFFDSATDSFSIWDSNLNMIYLNDATLEKYYPAGTKREDVIGRHFTELVPGCVESGRYAKYLNVLKTGEPVYIDEFQPHSRFGDMYLAIRVFKIENGLGIITIDNTERKRTERELISSQQRLAALIENAPDIIFSYDFNGIFRFGNKKVQELLGYALDDLVGKNIAESGLLSKEGILLAMSKVQENSRGITTGPDEYRLTAKNGSHIFIEAQGVPIVREEGAEVLCIAHDITRRRKMEDALRQSEEKLRRIINSLEDGLSITDLQGTVLDVNEKALELSGYSRDEFIGKFGLELLAERDRPRAMQDMLETFNSGYAGPKEYTCLTKDGKEFPAETRATVLYDESGNPSGLISILRDVTERKKMEERLRRSEQKIRQIFNSVGVGITVTDMEGKVTEINDYGLRLHGYSKAELIGQNGIRLIAERDRPRIIETIIQTFKTGRSSLQEFTSLKKDGTEYDVEAIATVLSDTSGKPTSLIISVTDITERKRIEEKLKDYKDNLEEMVEKRTGELSDAYAELKQNEAALKESEEKYKSLVEQLPQGIIIMQDNRIVFANSAMTQINGYSIEEMLSMTPAQVVGIAQTDTRERLARRIDERMQGKDIPEHSEWRIARRDGAERWLESFAVRIVFNGKPAIQATLTDITERKRLENALRNSEEKLRTMFTSMADGVIITDLEGNFRDANMSALNMFGYHSKEDVRDSNGFDFIADSDREIAAKDMVPLFAEGLVTGRSWRFKHSSGREFQAELSTALIKDAEGNPTDILVVMRDITERKRMEEARRESEEKLRATFEAIADGIAVADFTGKLIDMNSADIKLFGYENKEQLIDRDVLNFVAEADRERVINDITSIIASGKGAVGEYRLVDRNGKEFDAEVRGSVMRNSSGEPKAIVNVIRDITERKKAERALRESREELRFYLNQLTKAQEEERKKIARELHDDTIQELITLSRQLDDLIDKKIKPDEDRRESRNKIEAARHKVDAILNGVRQFTRDLRPSVLDDLGLVPALEWLSSEMSNRFGIPIDTSIIGKEQHVAPDAALAIFRVAQESLRNAGSHAEASQIQVNLKFTRQTATLSIIDDGKGFTPPKQTSKLTKLGKLGVAGMYERAQLIGAVLSIKSKRNKGTVVSLEVPLK